MALPLEAKAFRSALLNELSQSKPLPAVPPAVPVGLPGDLLKRRPDVREAEARVAAETARVGVAPLAVLDRPVDA